MTKHLPPLQRLILGAVADLKDNAYPVPIQRTIAKVSEWDVKYGRLYHTLDDMEYRQLLDSEWRDGEAARGYRRKRVYHLTPIGERALAHSLGLTNHA